MSPKQKLRIIQLFCFSIVTISVLIFGYYFPNLPPFIRAILPPGFKGKIKLQEITKVDKRFLKWFNRDPERNIPTDPNIIVSPADGIVEYIGKKNGNIHIVIEMRYTDVHVQRVPIDGVVVKILGEGKKLPFKNIGDYLSKKMLPYQKVTILNTEIGTVKVRQITSAFASRIQVYVHPGQHVKRGERLGRVLAGSTIVLEVPDTVKILVKKNQEVLAGESIIGKY